MANIQQPREIAELKGAHLKDPQRYRGIVLKSDVSTGNNEKLTYIAGFNGNYELVYLIDLIEGGIYTATIKAVEGALQSTKSPLLHIVNDRS